MQMNIAEAKAKLSELIAAAERGEDVLIARGGHPVVRLVLAGEAKPAFRIGLAEGALAHTLDFLEPLPEDERSLWE